MVCFCCCAQARGQILASVFLLLWRIMLVEYAYPLPKTMEVKLSKIDFLLHGC